jgi:hypothetical protein
MTGILAARAAAMACAFAAMTESTSGIAKPRRGSDPSGWMKPFCMSMTSSALDIPSPC